MERPKAGSFSTFLEEGQRLKSNANSMNAAPEPAPLTLVFKLAAVVNGQMKTSELKVASRMSVSGFADALKSLAESGYITISGPQNEEVAILTKMGEDVARLARPSQGA